MSQEVTSQKLKRTCDACGAVDRLRVAGVLGEHLREELLRAGRIAELLLVDLGGFGAGVARTGRPAGGVGAGHEGGRELGPLVGLPIEPGERSECF